MSVPVKKVKLVSDGTTHGTKITYDGNPIGTVHRMRIDIDCENPLAYCRLEIIVPELEIEFNDEAVSFSSRSMKKCPKCNKWVSPDITHLKDAETPLFIYTCLNCHWTESIEVPFEWDADKTEKGKVDKDD